jgi:XisH protein
MPNQDLYHEAVKNALIKQGWTITHDPYTIHLGGRDKLYIDLGAERILAAEKGTEKIAVEIKTFGSLSVYSDFHTAIGQYMSYQAILDELEPDRLLLLALPMFLQEWIENKLLPKLTFKKLLIKTMYYDPIEEEIVLWKI